MGLVILCMIILLVIFRRRWARKQSNGHDSDSITMLTPGVGMVENAVGHGASDSGHSTVELAGHAPVEHALDNRGWTPHLEPVRLRLSLIRELGL